LFKPVMGLLYRFTYVKIYKYISKIYKYISKIYKYISKIYKYISKIFLLYLHELFATTYETLLKYNYIFRY